MTRVTGGCAVALALLVLAGCNTATQDPWTSVDGVPTRDVDLIEWEVPTSPVLPTAMFLLPHPDGDRLWVYGAERERGAWRVPLLAPTSAIDPSGLFVDPGVSPSLVTINPDDGILLEPVFPSQRSRNPIAASPRRTDRWRGCVVHYEGRTVDQSVRWQVESGPAYPASFDARQWAHVLVGGVTPFSGTTPDQRYLGPLQVRLFRDGPGGTSSEAVYRVTHGDSTIHVGVAFDDEARWMYIKRSGYEFAVVPVEFPSPASLGG